MNSEQAGDRVFADVDRTLAEKIISRSKENNKTATPAADNVVDADDVPRRRCGLACAVKIAAAVVVAVLIVTVLILRRRGK